MKYCRVGKSGSEVPCAIDESGIARNLSSLVQDIGPQTIPMLKERVLRSDWNNLPVVDLEGVRFGTPMLQPRNIYCIGLNYSDHAKEAGMVPPKEPILFNKSSGSFCAPNSPILYSPNMSKLDWEVELGVVVGKSALCIGEEQALEHILGYTVVNDVSERAWQLEREGQWAKGKSFPNFCPTGPYIVSGDEIDNARNLGMWLDVNGRRMQTGNTRTMIFSCATIVSYLSTFVRLEPGDLICTGTPPGVGAGMVPPIWLVEGDEVSLGIEGLGEQSQTVISYSTE